MTNATFPPRHKNPSEMQGILDVLGCAISGKTATYFAVPITTGRRFFEWYPTVFGKLAEGTTEYNKQHHESVIQPNLRAAAARLASMRTELCTIVIDPRALDRPGWTQDDYRCLWSKVIERYVNRVALSEGWEYSSGCSYEFLSAVRSGADTCDEQLHPITVSDGIQLIRGAVKELNSHQASISFLEHVLSALELESKAARAF